jgi:hypothetical protein
VHLHMLVEGLLQDYGHASKFLALEFTSDPSSLATQLARMSSCSCGQIYGIRKLAVKSLQATVTAWNVQTRMATASCRYSGLPSSSNGHLVEQKDNVRVVSATAVTAQLLPIDPS